MGDDSGVRIPQLPDLHYDRQHFAERRGAQAPTLHQSSCDTLGPETELDAIVVSGNITNRAEPAERLETRFARPSWSSL